MRLRVPPNRYAVLVGNNLEDVRIDMANLPEREDSHSISYVAQASSTQEGESALLSSLLELPIRLETKPPPIRSLYFSGFVRKEFMDAGVGMGTPQKRRPISSVEPPAEKRQESLFQAELESLEHTPKEEGNSEGIECGSPVDAETANSHALHWPKIWDEKHPWMYSFMTNPLQSDPWETLKKGIDKYDKEMCDAWNGELDTILTFTGLFSAAVTAFCIESFQALSQNPADTTNVFLLIISQQLANSTTPAATMSMVEGFTPNASDVHINVLYFFSLVLALSVSTVCILGKQWIREYQKDLSVSACDAVRVRQARFDSLEAWKVPQIMAALPVILLLSLMLFFSGLLIQLWNVNNQTTAIVVSIAVGMTVLLVIVTTIVPACVSMQPRRSSFAPFRSPQAWIFFIVFRRIQIWYDAVVGAWMEDPPIFSSWSESDLHFLKIETRDWFEHRISSVHRALRWVVDVLRNSSEMEQSLLWCLRAKLHPTGLIGDGDQLTRHVLLDSNDEGASQDIHRVYYDYNRQNEGRHEIDIPVGRYQAELLLRSAHHAIDSAWRDRQTAWNAISHSCNEPWYHGVFNKYSEQETLRHQVVFQDQLALLFDRVFSIPPPSGPFEWDNIISLLLRARHDSSSPLSRQILPNVINQLIPAWIRTHISPSLLYGIGDATHRHSYWSWEPTIELFTQLDKIMVDWCSEPEGVEGLNQESVDIWRELRLKFSWKTRTGNGYPSNVAPEHLQLSDDYFEHLPGHGPLSISLPQSQLSSHAEGEPERDESSSTDLHR